MKTPCYCARVFAAVLSFFCLSSTLFAQKPAFSGYYIGISGDTVQGTFPDYRQWGYNPDEVKFLSLSGGGPIVLTPGNCNFFHIDGYDSYETYTGTRLYNSIAYNPGWDLTGPKDTAEAINTFLRIVFQSDTYKLMVFTDKRRSNFYIQPKGKPAEELRFKVYAERSPLLDWGIKEDPAFRRQLVAIFNNGKSKYDVNRLLDNVDYSEKSLVAFLKKMTGVRTASKKTGLSGKNSLVFSGGFSVNNLFVKGDQKIKEVGAVFNTLNSPAAGFGFMHRSERNFGKIFINPQLRFYRFKSNGEVNTNDYKVNITYQSDLAVNLSCNVGYDLVRTRLFSWYLSSGAGLLYLPGSQKKVVSKYIYSPNPSTSVYQAYSLRFSANLQTGILLKDTWSVWGCYAFPSNIMAYGTYSTYFKSLQTGISYHLKL